MFLQVHRGPRIFSLQLDVYVGEIPESNLGQVIGYPDTYISWFYSFTPGEIGIVPQIDQDAPPCVSLSTQHTRPTPCSL